MITGPLRQRGGGTFDLPEGTIYPALHRLEHAGLLASKWSEDTGRRRRVYELTRQGRAALEAQETPVVLPAMSLGQQMEEDYRHLHLSLKAHPAALVRPVVTACPEEVAAQAV